MQWQALSQWRHTSDNVNRGHRHNEKAQNAWNVHTDGRISGNKAEADSNKDGIDWNSKRIADNNKFDDAQVNTNIKDRKAQEANATGVAGKYRCRSSWLSRRPRFLRIAGNSLYSKLEAT